MHTELAQADPTAPAPDPAANATADPVADPAAVTSDDSGLFDACGSDPNSVCRWVFEQTDNSFLAIVAEWVVARIVPVLLILVGALVVSRLLKRAIGKLIDRMAAVPKDSRLDALRSKGPGRFLLNEHGASLRSEARAKTIGHVLTSIATFFVWAIAVFMMLGELGINIGPLIAGAGIAGVALGFGAQTVVRDFLAGIFMIVEDQYGVGDSIDVGGVAGTVEKMSLRTTTLREVTGTLWHVPNGEIKRVGNRSQLWSRALLDVEVAYDTDLRLAEGVIQRVANEMWRDPEWGGDELIEEPEVWGVQNLGASGIAIRLVIKTAPATQWQVERELRLRIKEAFDQAGIEIPFPQRTIWLRKEGDFEPSEKPDKSTIETAEVPRYRLGEAADEQAAAEAAAEAGADAAEESETAGGKKAGKRAAKKSG